ncbi:DNA-binding protein [Deinococcus sp.]|uniref:DNA-binding protein n=1 Tax=Deinococcus sp. TaxID=47478 RepID=UPI003C7A6383
MTRKQLPDLNIPKQVQANAKKGLELRQEHGFGGTKVGEATARLLAEGGTVTARKVRHISRYFPRHAHDNLSQTGKEGKPSRGYVAWLLWGGDEGRAWSEGLVEKLDQTTVSQPARR